MVESDWLRSTVGLGWLAIIWLEEEDERGELVIMVCG